ncbi:MAG TPA: hypothetical protein VHU84_18955 [Lacipirellulaceae bacterium]|jgi:hypothetical protein|nr:hypothetical protein [Lacipirellulaceae bacterium]
MHSTFLPPLLAADFIHLIIPLLAVIFAVLKHFFDPSKPATKQPGGPLLAGGPKAKPAENLAKATPATGQQADQLRNQVEEFLRRSGRPQAVGQPTQPPQQRPKSEIEVLVTPPSRSTERKPLPAAMRPGEIRPAPAALPISSAEKRGPRRTKKRQSVAEHVAEQVTSRTKSLAENASQLGRRIANEDRQFDSQMKAKFDHSIGTLSESEKSGQPPAESPPRDTPAAQIAAMLANPDGVRQAVLVNEILRRPSDRW